MFIFVYWCEMWAMWETQCDECQISLAQLNETKYVRVFIFDIGHLRILKVWETLREID